MERNWQEERRAALAALVKAYKKHGTGSPQHMAALKKYERVAQVARV